jgi:predicted RNA binding protein YcfA (HicA-like mRNA interferase family)
LSSGAGGSCCGSNGSHHIYGKTGSVVRLSIPIHGNRPLKVGLMRHLAKLAEIPDDELQ